MTTQVRYVPLRGGLDLVSSPMGIAEGSIIEGMNFEQVFGKTGYRRVDGYERFDGRVAPSDSTYYVLNFKNLIGAFHVGDVVMGASATAKVLFVESTRLIVTSLSGAFVDGEDLDVSAIKVAEADGTIETATMAEPNHLTYLKAAVESQRSLVQRVPGSGPIRGVHIFNGTVFAMRDAADGLSCALYKGTGSGWGLVRSGFLPGGKWDFETANFAGSSATLAFYACDGINGPFKCDGTAVTVIGPIYGSQATSSTSFSPSTGSKTFTIAETSRSWTTGTSLVIYSKADASKKMVGSVTSYSGTSLVVNVTIATGSGAANDWLIGLADYSDKPYKVVAHKSHLFLAYPSGQLQHSNIGDPLTYTSTAGSFGVGDTITDLTPIKGDVLAVFCRSKIFLLYGSSTTNWEMRTHSRDAGSIDGTAVEVAGAAMFIDDRGLVSLQSSQNYGDFESANLSRMIKPLIDRQLLKIVGVKAHKGKNLCRVYFNDGSGINATMFEPSALIDPKLIAFTSFRYDHVPTALCRGEKSDGTEVHYFGTYDGWVMREDVGYSFDGNPITAAFRLPFINLKAPSNKKRFRKLIIEADVGRNMTLNFRQLMDYGDGNYAAGRVNDGVFSTGGGAFDSGAWDTILWSAPMYGQAEQNIDGVGRNMSLLIWHEDDFMPSFTVQGIALHYSVLGVAR